MSQSAFNKKLLHPKHLPMWMAIFFWWLLIQLLPYRALMALGSVLGLLSARLAKRRSKIARRNIELCFPEKTPAERERILRESMKSLGMGLFESGMAWFAPRWRLRNLYRIEGLEHLHNAKTQGQGVIFTCFHFTTLEICSAFISSTYFVDGFYRPHKNAVYEYIQQRGRVRHNPFGQTIPRKDVRAIVSSLRKQRAIIYLPDQDYGRNHSVFAPFFGISAATVTAPAKLKRMSNAQIIPFSMRRLDNAKGYVISIFPELQGIDGTDELHDASLMNAFIEARIREIPEQYLWVHRRFKTRPEGEADLYKLGS